MAKIKVYELAKELGVPSKEVLEFLGGKNIEVKNHMSALEEADANVVRKGMAKGGQEAAKTEQETPKKKNIVHVFRPQNTQNGARQGKRTQGRTAQQGNGRGAQTPGKPMQVNNGRPAKAAPARPAGAALAPGKAEPARPAGVSAGTKPAEQTKRPAASGMAAAAEATEQAKRHKHLSISPLRPAETSNQFLCLTSQISSRDVELIHQKARESSATMNDVFMTAYARVIAQLQNINTVVLPCPADLRRFCPELDTLTIANMTGIYRRITVEIPPGCSFGMTLQQVHIELALQKSRYRCFVGIKALDRMFHKAPRLGILGDFVTSCHRG